MRILITGAAGFIGSHLTERLLGLGHTVTGIDNFDPFYPKSVKQSNLEGALRTPGFTFYECDLFSMGSLLEKKKAEFDLVVHLAARAGVRPSIENPAGYIEANILGTYYVLEWMKKSSCKKMLFASSSSVYGNNRKVPFAENDPVDFPISPYAFTKKSCELLNHNYHHLYRLSIINLRFFTVYGPRQRPDLAIHKFFELIYNDKPVPIYGDGSTGRDYTYISDTVGGIVASADRIAKEKVLFETYNLGNSSPVLLRDLVDTIEKITGRQVRREFLPMQEGDVERTFADIALARVRLGFNPSVPLSEGLKNFKAWFEGKLVY
jgi:nucleoside-diphosphate-sugar epimerase